MQTASIVCSAAHANPHRSVASDLITVLSGMSSDASTAPGRQVFHACHQPHRAGRRFESRPKLAVWSGSDGFPGNGIGFRLTALLAGLQSARVAYDHVMAWAMITFRKRAV